MNGDRPDYHCLIVGAGFSGIGAAIKLDQAGFGDYLVVEAGDEVGGTWYWNTYPGIAVDIPSASYQYSFEQRPDWSRTYARGGELKAYAEHCTDKYGIRPKIRFNTTVLSAEFDDERRELVVHFERKTADAETVIGAALTVLLQQSARISGVTKGRGLEKRVMEMTAGDDDPR